MRNLSWIILFPLAVALIVFAVSNRGVIPVDLWPLPVSLDIPLFVLLFAALTIGVFWGGVASWLSGANARKASRVKAREARLAETEIRHLKAQISTLEADAKSRESQMTAVQNARAIAAPKNLPELPSPRDAA